MPKTCEKCSLVNRDDAKYCDNCGSSFAIEGEYNPHPGGWREQDDVKPPKKTPWLFDTPSKAITTILVIISVFIAVIASMSSPKATATAYRPAVEQSALDASVWQVKKYIRDNAKDPDSVKYIEWSPLTKTDSGYLVRCKYSGTNSFGGRVTANQIFYLDASGNITGVKDF